MRDQVDQPISRPPSALGWAGISELHQTPRNARMTKTEGFQITLFYGSVSIYEVEIQTLLECPRPFIVHLTLLLHPWSLSD